MNPKFHRLLGLALLALLSLSPAASAHRLDEYLQATLVQIEPGELRLQINLTPGVAVAEQVLAAIDRDRDGIISADENTTYAEQLRRDLDLRVDGHQMDLSLSAIRLPTPDELRTGFEIIQVEFKAVPGPLTTGPHEITLLNRHLPAMSVYLFNAAKPQSDTIEITAQKRNPSQSIGKIEFNYHPPAEPVSPPHHGSLLWPCIIAALAAAIFALQQRKALSRLGASHWQA